MDFYSWVELSNFSFIAYCIHGFINLITLFLSVNYGIQTSLNYIFLYTNQQNQHITGTFATFSQQVWTNWIKQKHILWENCQLNLSIKLFPGELSSIDNQTILPQLKPYSLWAQTTAARFIHFTPIPILTFNYFTRKEYA